MLPVIDLAPRGEDGMVASVEETESSVSSTSSGRHSAALPIVGPPRGLLARVSREGKSFSGVLYMIIYWYSFSYWYSIKIPVGYFLGLRHCANPLGELTRPTAVGGAPIEVRTSLPGQECQPTQLTRRASPGDPPGGDRLTRWQMSLLTLQQQPEVSTRFDTGRWRPRAGCPLRMRSRQPAKRGEGESPASWEGGKLLPNHQHNW